MEKDKYDFILDLLNDQKVSPAQRERILRLASSEIEKDRGRGEFLEERIMRLEEMLGIGQRLNISNTVNDSIYYFENIKNAATKNEEYKESTKIKLPSYFHPSSLYKYLFEYNQNPILRSTCHEIDGNALADIKEFCETANYNFGKHREQIASAFEIHDNSYFCPPASKALIRGYITGTDFKKNDLITGWSSDGIKMNWQNNELYNWANEKNMPPNLSIELLRTQQIRGFEIEGFTSKLFGTRVQTFRELVIHFKRLFHIRADNSLKSILIGINNRKDFSNRIEFDLNNDIFSNNIELFTDVDKLIQAYIKIIELIIEQHREDTLPNVKLSFFEANNKVYFSIHHLNNTYNKSIQNTIERIGQTYTNLIKRQLNGLCNLFLRADYGTEGHAEINLWDGKDRHANKEGLGSFTGGVEHIFEFCKTEKS